MNPVPPPTPSLALTASQYQTKVTLVAIPDFVTTQLLIPDSRRWYVHFSRTDGTNLAFTVGPTSDSVASTAGTAYLYYEWKFRDAPSLVTGEWWACGVATGMIRIIEVLYVGG